MQMATNAWDFKGEKPRPPLPSGGRRLRSCNSGSLTKYNLYYKNSEEGANFKVQEETD